MASWGFAVRQSNPRRYPNTFRVTPPQERVCPSLFALVHVAMADMESDSQSLSQDLEEIRQVELPNIDETQIVDGLDEEVSR